LPKSLVGVVWQEDLLLPNLTVRETVRFAARLKTPKFISDEDVDELVDETLTQLGLSAVKDSLIGLPSGGVGRGISGGERKRVSVAVELVAKPSVLLLE
jgi:ABC-type multidrug transport system ATPase subunit